MSKDYELSFLHNTKGIIVRIRSVTHALTNIGFEDKNTDEMLEKAYKNLSDSMIILKKIIEIRKLDKEIGDIISRKLVK